MTPARGSRGISGRHLVSGPRSHERTTRAARRGSGPSDGAPLPASAPASGTPAPESAPAGAAASQAEDDLRRIVLELTPAQIAYFDRTGRLRFSTPAHTRAIGRPLDQLIGRTVEELGLSPARSRQMRELGNRAAAMRQPRARGHQLRRGRRQPRQGGRDPAGPGTRWHLQGPRSDSMGCHSLSPGGASNRPARSRLRASEPDQPGDRPDPRPRRPAGGGLPHRRGGGRLRAVLDRAGRARRRRAEGSPRRRRRVDPRPDRRLGQGRTERPRRRGNLDPREPGRRRRGCRWATSEWPRGTRQLAGHGCPDGRRLSAPPGGPADRRLRPLFQPAGLFRRRRAFASSRSWPATSPSPSICSRPSGRGPSPWRPSANPSVASATSSTATPFRCGSSTWRRWASGRQRRRRRHVRLLARGVPGDDAERHPPAGGRRRHACQRRRTRRGIPAERPLAAPPQGRDPPGCRDHRP